MYQLLKDVRKMHLNENEAAFKRNPVKSLPFTTFFKDATYVSSSIKQDQFKRY